MKKIAVLLILLSVGNYISAQVLQIDWQSCFGGTETENSRDIVVTANGYIIAGSTTSNDFDVVNNHGATDGWIVKTNDIGELEWTKTYGGTKGDGIFRIFTTNESNYFLIGGTNSSNGDISFDPYPNTQDYWIVKIDSSGNILWDKIVGGNGHDQIWTGTSTSDGGVVAFGWTNSDDGDVSTYYGGYDMWLIKLNNEGEIVWDKTFGGSGFDYGQSIIETSDKGFLIGGGGRIQGNGNLTCDSYHGDLDAFLLKLDSLGNIEWQQCYGGSRGESFTGIKELEDGYLATAYTDSEDGDVSGWHPGYPEPRNDIWAVKVDFSGNILWQKCLGGSRAEYCSSISQTTEGDLILVGVTQSNDGDVSGNHTVSEHNHDIWMVKLSSEGELLWQQCIGGAGDEIVNFGVIQKSDNRYVIAGQSDWASDDVECDIHHVTGSWWPDFWVFEVYDTTVSITETPGDVALKVYPNPASNYIIFELPVISNPSVVISSESEKSPQHNPQSPPQIIITNTLGQHVAQIEIKGNKTVWDARCIRAGVYFYFLEIEGKQYSGKVVIQK